MRYQSSFDVESLIHAAQKELPQELFKIFLLAIMAGLRRNEIDKLEWQAFDWGKGVISIRSQGTYSHYRCQKHFDGLIKWLRDQGVEASKPLHTLRKEYGSQVCARHGIYAASLCLRHADISISSQHYLDKRQRATAGLGALLVKPCNVVSIETRQKTVST
jgi:integrase